MAAKKTSNTPTIQKRGESFGINTSAGAKVLKEVLFDDVEEKKEYEFLTRDQFFQKVPETRPMSVRGIEMWERYLQNPKGFKF